MKKIIIAATMLATCFAVNAQEPSASTAPATKMYKPVAGNVLAEIGLFSNGIMGGNLNQLPVSTFGTPQLKFRYFLADQLAVRVGFNYTQNSSTKKFYDPTGASGSDKNMSSVFGLNLGLEKHFTGTGRLSTYAGGDLSFQKVGVSEKWDNSANGTTYTSGASTKFKGTNNAGANSSTGFGLRGVAGADYYFVDKVYLGAEFGWGFMVSKDSKSSVATSGAPTVNNKSGGGSFNLAPSLTAGLRLGFRF